MDSIGAFEAKTHFSSLLERVEKGEEITITRHGRPVARLVPVQQRDNEAIKRAMDDIIRIRNRSRLRGLKIKDLISKGRR